MSEFPPGTAGFLSWTAIQYLRAPSPRIFQWTLLTILSAMILSFAIIHFVSVDVTVSGQGEIVPAGGVGEATTQTDGLISDVFKRPGDRVEKDEVIALLATDNLAPAEIADCLQTMDQTIRSLKTATGTVALQLEALALPLDRVTDPGLLQSFVDLDESQDLFFRRGNEFRSRFLKSLVLARAALATFQMRHEIRSPIKGVVDTVDAAPGAYVQAHQLIAGVVSRETKYIATLRIPSKYISSIKLNQKVQYKVSPYAYQQSGLFTGKVISIEPIADEFIVMAGIDPPASQKDLRLMNGMRLTAQILTDRKTLSQIVLGVLFR